MLDGNVDDVMTRTAQLLASFDRALEQAARDYYEQRIDPKAYLDQSRALRAA